jgi:hypothetical protein
LVERQKKLSDFSSILVKYIPVIKDVGSWSGRSERVFSRLLKKQGYQVWRGGLIHRIRQGDVYPVFRRKYFRLCLLLDE